MSGQVFQRTGSTGDVRFYRDGGVPVGSKFERLEVTATPYPDCPGSARTAVLYSGDATTDLDYDLTLLEGYYNYSLKAYRAGQKIWEIQDEVGVGEQIITAGQSMLCSQAATRNVPSSVMVRSFDPLTPAARFGSDELLCQVNGPPGKPGSMFPLLGDLLVNQLNVPVMFINVAWGGTSILDWIPSGGIHWNRIVAAVTLFPDARLFGWDQGQNDPGMSMMEYQGHLEDIVDGIQAIAPGMDCGIAVSTWANSIVYPQIQSAQIAVQGYASYTFAGPDTDVLDNTYRYDTTHFNNVGLGSQAALYFAAWAAKFGW